MKDKNTFSTITFIALNGLGSFVAVIIFNILFSGTPISVSGNVFLQILVITVSVNLSAFICIRYRRNWVGILTNAASLCAWLFILCCFTIFYLRIFVATGVCAVFVWLYARIVWRQHRDGKRSRENAVRYTIHAAKGLFGICIVSVMFISVGIEQVSFGHETEENIYIEEKILDNNMDVAFATHN